MRGSHGGSNNAQPLAREGIPLDKQFRSWKEIATSPYDKLDVDAYMRTRVILMNGIEIEAWNFSHQFHRSTDNQEIRTLLAHTRRVDQQQQTTINGLNPGDQTIIETTIGYEQVAIDMTAYLARNEPDPYVRESMNFGLLEDFDHLHRYASSWTTWRGPTRTRSSRARRTSSPDGPRRITTIIPRYACSSTTRRTERFR